MKKLRDITELINRKAPADSSAPVMMISQRSGFIYQADKYSRENAGQSLKKYTLLRRGEMAYNHGASKAKPYGVAYLLKEEDEARVPFVYHTFRIVDGDPRYWHLALNTSEMDRKLKQLVSSGVRMDGLLNISYDNYAGVSVACPCLEEQQKIADFLSDIDEVISASEAEVATLELQKRGIMQKLLSQEVRFRRDDGTEFPNWEKNRLGELATCSKGAPLSKADISDSGNPFILYGELYTTYGEVAVNIVRKTESIVSDEFISRGDDVLIPTSGETPEEISTATCVMVPGVILAGDLYILRSNVLDGRILSYLLNHQVNLDIARIAQGKSVVHLRWDELKKIVVTYPVDVDEQQKIAAFLSDIDKSIDLAKRELEQWKLLKKGLMQRMFV